MKPLTLLYNSCISSSIFPDDLKKAEVITLHKNLEKIFVDNYRPISLLNCFSKIFERLVHKQVVSFLHKHALLYQYQFGFREKHSTTLALIEIIDGIKNDIDKGDITIGTYLDLKKSLWYSKPPHIVWEIISLWYTRECSWVLWKLSKKS